MWYQFVAVAALALGWKEQKRAACFRFYIFFAEMESSLETKSGYVDVRKRTNSGENSTKMVRIGT